MSTAPSSSIWRRAGLPFGKAAPSRHSAGCSASSQAQSGWVAAAKPASSTGFCSIVRSGVSSTSACFRKVEPMKSGGAG